jgi:diguanylate cyclase (GGDEF)-like protein
MREAEPAADARLSPGPTRVLVVDDNAVVRRLMGTRLRAGGFDVAEAGDGLAALEEYQKHPAHVVITDLSMPRLDGLALLEALRMQPSPPEVILLTGTRATDAEAAVQALRLGAHDYITKSPAAVEAVALAAERAAEKWRLREENARLLRELRRASLTDALTGAGNRRAFDEALAQEVARSRRAGTRIALAMFDLDHFKLVNDTHGHHVGDEALVAFTERLRSVVRASDRVFRYGGEEFAVLLAEERPEAALAAAARIVRTIGAQPLAACGLRLALTCSAGVSLLRASDDSAGRELVARADVALYAAKRGGRNRAEVLPEPEGAAVSLASDTETAPGPGSSR